jgi:2-octaprenyl-6-methoxyphenol hydroxylase
VTFPANEVGLSAFGCNAPNDALSRALFERCAKHESITLITRTSFSGVDVDADNVVLTLDHGRQITATLLVAADGRRSPVRQALGIEASTQDYRQSAIVCSFDHERPHNATSIELHRPGGPFELCVELGDDGMKAATYRGG